MCRFNCGHTRKLTDNSTCRFSHSERIPGLFNWEVGRLPQARLSKTTIGLALQSWAAILVLLVAIGFGYANRIRLEERFLVAELGDDYVEYCKRTKRIIPFIF